MQPSAPVDLERRDRVRVARHDRVAVDEPRSPPGRSATGRARRRSAAPRRRRSAWLSTTRRCSGVCPCSARSTSQPSASSSQTDVRGEPRIAADSSTTRSRMSSRLRRGRELAAELEQRGRALRPRGARTRRGSRSRRRPPRGRRAPRAGGRRPRRTGRARASRRRSRRRRASRSGAAPRAATPRSPRCPGCGCRTRSSRRRRSAATRRARRSGR